jgi:hypothetical protein
LTLRQFDDEKSDNSVSIVFEEDNPFANDYAKGKENVKSSSSKQPRHFPENNRKEGLPHHALPKMLFPKFDGTQPKIWFTKCDNYFDIYSIPEDLWVQAASMHLEGNVAKWWEAYKITHPSVTWKTFCDTIQENFGSDDYKNAINGLLNLKQTRIVEDYTTHGRMRIKREGGEPT